MNERFGGFPRNPEYQRRNNEISLEDAARANEPLDPQRRKILRGALATMGFALVPSSLGEREETDGVPDDDRTEVEANIESQEEHSQSGYFLRQLQWHSERFEAEMPQIAENLDVLTTIQSNFSAPNLPSYVESRLKGLLAGIAIEESRLKSAAVSEDGAFGYLQIMPSTWNELAKEGEDKESLVDQTKVAARLFEQSHQHLQNTTSKELKQIQERFFDGDENRFYEEFYTPVLINSYNAGMGSMSELIKWFAAEYQDPAALIDPFDDTTTRLSGYDVFVALAHIGDQNGISKWYKEKAGDYACKVYAANDVFNEVVDAQTRKELGFDPDTVVLKRELEEHSTV